MDDITETFVIILVVSWMVGLAVLIMFIPELVWLPIAALILYLVKLYDERNM